MAGPAASAGGSHSAPHRYRLHGRVLASDMELPELEPATFGEPELGLWVADARSQGEGADGWFHQDRLADGSLWLSKRRTAEGYLLRFHGLADFMVGADGTWIRCHPLPGLSSSTLRHLALDAVVPLALTLGGIVVVHAGAVASPEGAVALVGPTGSGKSTLTAALVAAEWPLIADDALVIDDGPAGPTCLPGYPGLRLWPDSLAALGAVAFEVSGPVAHYSAKLRLALQGHQGRSCSRPTPLRRLYLLEEAEVGATEPRIVPASRREGLLALFEAQFCMDPGDPDLVRRGFEALARVVESAEVARLHCPKRFDLLQKLPPLIGAPPGAGPPGGERRRL